MKQLGKYQAVSSKKAIISLLNTYIAWTKIPKYSPNTEQLPALVHILQIKKNAIHAVQKTAICTSVSTHKQPNTYLTVLTAKT